MKAVTVGRIKLSVVSESMISKYNLHNNPLRCISEETAQDEMFVAYNCPEIGESITLLGETLSKYLYPKGWQFIKANHMFLNEGKTAERILTMKIDLPFFM